MCKKKELRVYSFFQAWLIMEFIASQFGEWESDVDPLLFCSFATQICYSENYTFK